MIAADSARAELRVRTFERRRLRAAYPWANPEAAPGSRLGAVLLGIVVAIVMLIGRYLAGGL